MTPVGSAGVGTEVGVVAEGVGGNVVLGAGVDGAPDETLGTGEDPAVGLEPLAPAVQALARSTTVIVNARLYRRGNAVISKKTPSSSRSQARIVGGIPAGRRQEGLDRAGMASPQAGRPGL